MEKNKKTSSPCLFCTGTVNRIKTPILNDSDSAVFGPISLEGKMDHYSTECVCDTCQLTYNDLPPEKGTKEREKNELEIAKKQNEYKHIYDVYMSE